MNFEFVDEVVTEVSNSIFGYIDTKKKVQKSLMLTIQMSCVEYSKNPEFKRKLDIAADFYGSH